MAHLQQPSGDARGLPSHQLLSTGFENNVSMGGVYMLPPFPHGLSPSAPTKYRQPGTKCFISAADSKRIVEGVNRFRPEMTGKVMRTLWRDILEHFKGQWDDPDLTTGRIRNHYRALVQREQKRRIKETAEVEPQSGKRRKVGAFSPQEVAALKRGIEIFGHNWKAIRTDPRFIHCFHPSRTAVDLKDKARNLTSRARVAAAKRPAKRTKRTYELLDSVDKSTVLKKVSGFFPRDAALKLAAEGHVDIILREVSKPRLHLFQGSIVESDSKTSGNENAEKTRRVQVVKLGVEKRQVPKSRGSARAAGPDTSLMNRPALWGNQRHSEMHQRHPRPPQFNQQSHVQQWMMLAHNRQPPMFPGQFYQQQTQQRHNPSSAEQEPRLAHPPLSTYATGSSSNMAFNFNAMAAAQQLSGSHGTRPAPYPDFHQQLHHTPSSLHALLNGHHPLPKSHNLHRHTSGGTVSSALSEPTSATGDFVQSVVDTPAPDTTDSWPALVEATTDALAQADPVQSADQYAEIVTALSDPDHLGHTELDAPSFCSSASQVNGDSASMHESERVWSPAPTAGL